MALASNQLGYNAAVGAAFVTIYTCPAGKRCIVKCVMWQNLAAVINRVIIQVNNGGVDHFDFASTLQAVNAAGESVILLPWLVLLPGDALKAFATHASAEIIASGAELTL